MVRPEGGSFPPEKPVDPKGAISDYEALLHLLESVHGEGVPNPIFPRETSNGVGKSLDSPQK